MGEKLAECVMLPHCDIEGVKLVETHAEPLLLAVTEVEWVGVNVMEIVPLGLLLADALRDAVVQTLCVALPHCEGDAVKLVDTHEEGEILEVCVALPHCEGEGV